MPFPAFFRRKFSVNKMNENTIFRCLFYISSVFGKIQYGKKGTTVTPSSKKVRSKGRDVYPSEGQRHHFYAKELLSIPSQRQKCFQEIKTSIFLHFS